MSGAPASAPFTPSPVMGDASERGSGAVANDAPVSVVVCAYTLDRWDDLVAAVTTLQQQSRPPAEIIVVSDHNPRLFERVRAAWPGITALENDEARGLSGARNTGVLAASEPIVAFLDDDARADLDWLRRLLATYDHPGVLGAGGAILPAWESGRPAWFPEEFDWVVGCTYKGMPLTRSRQRNLIGANMSFRRDLFRSAGGFQTGMGRIGTLPLGCEETELCIRGTQKFPGAYYVYEPQARVYHRVPATRATWRYFISRCYSEGLSKAMVSQLVGAGAGLSSERTYTTRTLPTGVLRGIGDALTRRRPGGLGRATAIVAGFAVTVAGYVRGRFARPSSQQRAQQPQPSMTAGEVPEKRSAEGS
jgi:glucosyl-dolichyl phosphate glucuronosyltransferase